MTHKFYEDADIERVLADLRRDQGISSDTAYVVITQLRSTIESLKSDMGKLRNEIASINVACRKD